jgi:hypothetical protein
MLPFIRNIHTFLRRNCVIWDHKFQLQGLSSDVCGHYFCLFALYVDRVLPLNNSSACLLPPTRTGKSVIYSRRNLASYAKGTLAGANAAPISMKGR